MCRSRTPVWCLLSLVAALAMPVRAHALFHLAVIDELASSYAGDDTQQFIEVRMLGVAQNFVAHSVFAAFDADGTYVGDILEVPANVTNSGANVRWLVATTSFQTAHGVTADFPMPPTLPVAGGMVCFGGGGGLSPANPPNWDRTNFATYVDCVAYGTYHGPANIHTGTPTTRAGVGHSLQRGTSTNNNAADFACSDSLTPQSNNGTVVTLPSTIPCACGNGVLEGSEQCDDGNQAPGDCCKANCTDDTAGSPCTDDQDACTTDQCDAFGGCAHTPTGNAFGSDDSGCLPSSTAIAKCEDGVAKATGKLAASIIKCHIARADAKKIVDDSGEDACENDAIAKFTAKTKTVGCMPCTNLAAIAATVESVLDAQNDDAFCAGSTPFGGDDTGNVPPDKDTGKCEDKVAKSAGKLAADIIKCHIGRADGKKITDQLAEETCEQTAIGKFTTKTKTDTCNSCTDLGTIAANVELAIDTNNKLIYCAP